MTADIKTIRPDVQLTTTAFMAKCGAQVPDGAPVVLMWIDENGAAHVRTNNTLRRDQAWMAANLQAMALHGNFGTDE